MHIKAEWNKSSMRFRLQWSTGEAKGGQVAMTIAGRKPRQAVASLLASEPTRN
jgi:hypothetical protein